MHISEYLKSLDDAELRRIETDARIKSSVLSGRARGGQNSPSRMQAQIARAEWARINNEQWRRINAAQNRS